MKGKLKADYIGGRTRTDTISLTRVLIGTDPTMTAVNLDVNAARLAHLRWELALEALVNGVGAREPMQGHEDCVLGTWIYGTGLRRYGGLGSVWELKTVHKRFHHVAEEIMAALASGDEPAAAAALQTARRLSAKILYLLTALELDVIEMAVDKVRADNIPSRFMRLFLPKPRNFTDFAFAEKAGDDPTGRRLNVGGARLTHLKWIRSLQMAFRGHGKNVAAQPSEECSLGVWIHGVAMKELGTNEYLKALDVAHKRFHREVGTVLMMLRSRNARRADEAYEEALALSAEIVALLTRLQLDLIDSQLLSVESSKL